MLTGLSARLPGAFLLLHTLRNNKSGFTIIEVLLVALLLGVLMSALFYALVTSQTSNLLTSAQMDLQAEVRRSVDWMSKDVRQTRNTEIADSGNAPNATHIKFRQVLNFNISSNASELSANYTEYMFNATSGLLRNSLNATNATVTTWYFNNITNVSFSTRDNSNNQISLTGNATALRSSGKLIVSVTGAKAAPGVGNTSVNLTEEIMIRNNF